MPYDPKNLTVQFRVGDEHLAADLQKVTDTIQRKANTAFKGGGTSGLATDPNDAILGILGVGKKRSPYTINADKVRAAYAAPFIAQMKSVGMGQLPGLFGKPMTPGLPSFMSGGFFQPSASNALISKMKGIGQSSLYGGIQGGPHTPAMPAFLQNPNFFKKSGPSMLSKLSDKLVGLIAPVAIVATAFKALTMSMDEFHKATERASQLYAKSLTTGLGTRFVQQRQSIAQIMGVSEKDVIQFGAAFQFLNPKIQWATNILSQSNRTLTAVSWHWKLLDLDLTALAATIAYKLAPAAENLISILDFMVKGITGIAVSAGAFITLFSKSTNNASLLLLSQLFGKFSAMNFGKFSPIPQPQSYMKQLGASALEHMGLVAGNGGAAQHAAEETARNTKLTSTYLSEILRLAQSHGKSDSFSPFVTGASHL